MNDPNSSKNVISLHRDARDHSILDGMSMPNVNDNFSYVGQKYRSLNGNRVYDRMSFNPNNTKGQIFGSKVLGAIHNDEDSTIFHNLKNAIMNKVNSNDPNSSKKAEFLMDLISNAFNEKQQFKLKGSSNESKDKWIKNMAKAQFFISKLRKTIDSKIDKSDYNYVTATNILDKIESKLRNNMGSKDMVNIKSYLKELDISSLLNELKVDYTKHNFMNEGNNRNLLYKLKNMNSNLNETLEETTNKAKDIEKKLHNFHNEKLRLNRN